MRRLTFLLLCLFIGIGVATAQTMKITGNVISSEDQQPVIGAAVVVKGTTIGTVTDFEGNFSLDVPRDAKMIFISYVGLKTKLCIGNNYVKFTLILHIANNQL